MIEKLENKLVKDRLIQTMEKTISQMEMPLAVKTLVTMNIGQVRSSINDMSDETLDEFIEKAYNMHDYIKYGECE